MRIERVGIVGCGLMGSGIAEVCARSGLDVIVVESDEVAMRHGERRILESLAYGVSKGKLSGSDRETVRERLRFDLDLDALADRDIVIEAVVEDQNTKTETFERLDKIVVDDRAILASNTSSIPIMKLATVTSRPESVVGMHFFNPVPVLPLVEVIPSLLTTDDVVERTATFAEQALDKHVIRSQDRAGFVVNALLIPYILSAVRMLESGFATAADIDAGMVMGCAHPMGPLALADLIGLDTTTAVAQSLYDEFKEPLYAPPPMLNRLVDAGLLGRKTGRGFHQYPRS